MSGEPEPAGSGPRAAGVIGHPVAHSLSPAIHDAAFAACGLDWTYLVLDVPPGRGGEAVRAMPARGLTGLSVTMPHKEAAAAAVDRLSDDAAALGAVNTVTLGDDGVLTGESTDGAGFIDSLRGDHGIDVGGWRAVVIGAGGAARAVVLALAGAGAAEVGVLNRTSSRAERAAALAGARGSVVAATRASASVASADLVVNATPLGMAGVAEGELPVDPGWLRPGQVVVDLVYRPLETPLLLAAVERGARPVDGLGMLVHQAAHQFGLWTGVEPPLPVMFDAVRRRVS
ncbi:MAG: shikimate dehydrogenase [Acidimicrobiales bacterium]